MGKPVRSSLLRPRGLAHLALKDLPPSTHLPDRLCTYTQLRGSPHTPPRPRLAAAKTATIFATVVPHQGHTGCNSMQPRTKAAY